MNNKFSIIITASDRLAEIERLLRSLVQQSYKNFELIVVDHGSQGKLRGLVERYCSKLPGIKLVDQPDSGLSKSRNMGLKHVAGDIVAFADDDCWYPPELLEQVNVGFNERPEADVLSGKVVAPSGKEVAGRFLKKNAWVNKFTVWRAVASVTLFVKREFIDRTGAFDESLGVGSGTRVLSGEETDYALRLLQNGARIYYNSSLKVFHPDPLQNYDDQAIQRAYGYGCGAGRVLKKNHYPLWFKLIWLARPLLAALTYALLLNFQRSSFYLASFRGRLIGLVST